jgi:hypothetical protein
MIWQNHQHQMGVHNLLHDQVTVVSSSGEQRGPIKASVQANKVFIFDTTLTIEEGGKILRTLPNGQNESFSILEKNIISGPSGDHDPLSHFEVLVRKDTSLRPAARNTTINISNSHGFQIGDGNTQQIISSLEMLGEAIESTNVPEPEKKEAKNRIKALLSHPLVVSLLGSAAKVALEKI